MEALWRLAGWGLGAVAAVAVAALAGRGGAGEQRASLATSNLNGQPSQQAPSAAPSLAQAGKHPFDAESETRRLSEAVRVLTSDRDRLTNRISMLEHNLDDVTGSVTKELEAARAAAKTAAEAPWPAADEPPTPPATIAATVALAPVAPAGLPIAPVAPMAAAPPPAAARDAAPREPADAAGNFAVDIGGGLTIEALRVRWNSVRLGHPQLFDGLRPLVTINDTHKSSRVELRLVVGPLPSPEAAAHLCAALVASRIVCQPAVYDGQRLALR